MKRENIIKTLIILVYCVAIFYASKEQGMFWDNVLFASKMGTQLFSQGIFNWYIPENFDPGHPPFLGFVLAIGWKLLGKSLWVSHLMMMPFVFGILWQLYSLTSCFFSKNNLRIAATILVAADPTLSAQFVLVNPEVIQIFFFLMAVNAILKNNYFFKFLGLFFLGIVTFRGMMLCGGILLFDVGYSILIKKTGVPSFINKKNIIAYVAGALPAIIFIVWHIAARGYLIQTSPDSPWAGAAHFVNTKQFIFNLIVIVHRHADFGRCMVLLFILWLMLSKKSLFKETSVQSLLLLAFISTFFISIYSLLSTNAMGHRYFIPSYLSFALLAAVLITYVNITHQKILYFILLSALLTGNLWVYPKKIAQGWDASLAHMPYFKLRLQAINYLDNQKTTLDSVATFFPNDEKLDDITLNGDFRSFAYFTGKNPYVFYSNVYNLSNEEYKMIEQNYTILKTFKNTTVSISILKNKYTSK